MNKNQKIIIIDYDMGNLGSIKNMIKKLGYRSEISKNKNKILHADKIILPGDGSFDTGMNNINKFGLRQIITQKVIKDKIPLLGICLGMQLLTRKSEEGKEKGLSWLKAQTVRFKFSGKKTLLRIPHMGWNTINIVKSSQLLKNLPVNSRFYFVHSYHLVFPDEKDVVATTEHGYDFPAVIEHNNIFATQFHPEKSHKFGMSVYDNFLKLLC